MYTKFMFLITACQCHSAVLTIYLCISSISNIYFILFSHADGSSVNTTCRRATKALCNYYSGCETATDSIVSNNNNPIN